jgi:uncharacterized protein YdeI (BOF family)
MSVTFSGGITFTGGGFSFSEAPPAQGTAGWFGGGYSPATRSTVQRITFATDTATASVRGPLTAGKYGHAASGNFTYGWFATGINYNLSPTGRVTTVDRITYATDTTTASSRGPMVYAVSGVAGVGDVTAGWFSGGYYANTPASFNYSTFTQRITYATDTATASGRGSLSGGIRETTAVTDGNTYGSTYCWIVGGTTGDNSSLIQRITYATDTATASVRGPLSVVQAFLGSVFNTTYGWAAGGYNGVYAITSTVQRITYATDTATASVRGPIYTTTYGSGTGDANYGWVGGGRGTGGTFLATVQQITYATDTATATARGSLSESVSRQQSTSGIQ